jgi:4-hydroxybenzoate polyprenyltransferase
MLRTIRHILEMIRFSHTLFALPFALLAAVMAWHATHLQLQIYDVVAEADKKMRDATPLLQSTRPDGSEFVFVIGANPLEPRAAFQWQEVVGLLLCMAAARGFAMSINRLADRKLDAENPRTAGRHLPAGVLNVGQVSAFAIACAAVFVVSTLWFLPNWLPLALSIPVLVFLAGYSYAKRFTWLAHVWLGAALGLSPVAAWIAIRGDVVLVHPADLLPAVVLGAAVLTWVAGFDILYACQDYDADRKAELHSVPVRFGIPGALRIAAACHLATIALLAVLPIAYPPFGWIYWAGVAAVAVLLVYEHLLVRPDDLSRVNIAFFRVNAVISLGLFAVGTLDLLVAQG